jgi:hypothetical protein
LFHFTPIILRVITKKILTTFLFFQYQDTTPQYPLIHFQDITSAHSEKKKKMFFIPTQKLNQIIKLIFVLDLIVLKTLLACSKMVS